MRPDLQKRLEAVASVLDKTADVAERAISSEKYRLRKQILKAVEKIGSISLSREQQTKIVAYLDLLGTKLTRLGK
jgi:hypothetical protein